MNSREGLNGLNSLFLVCLVFNSINNTKFCVTHISKVILQKLVISQKEVGVLVVLIGDLIKSKLRFDCGSLLLQAQRGDRQQLCTHDISLLIDVCVIMTDYLDPYIESQVSCLFKF